MTGKVVVFSSEEKLTVELHRDETTTKVEHGVLFFLRALILLAAPDPERFFTKDQLARIDKMIEQSKRVDDSTQNHTRN